MFCHACGVQLRDGAKFCSNCGTRVIILETTALVVEPVVEEAVAEETVVELPVMEEAVVEPPVVEEISVDEPIVEETVEAAPVVEEFIAEGPVVEPIIETVPEPAYEPTPEPVYEPIVEPAVAYEPVVEPVVEATPEPVYEPVPAPVYEPTPEPVYEPIVEPAVEPAVAHEPVVEPVIEATPEPVYEPVTEPAYEPVVEPVVEPAVAYEPVVEPAPAPTYQEPVVEPTPIPVPAPMPAMEYAGVAEAPAAPTKSARELVVSVARHPVFFIATLCALAGAVLTLLYNYQLGDTFDTLMKPFYSIKDLGLTTTQISIISKLTKVFFVGATVPGVLLALFMFLVPITALTTKKLLTWPLTIEQILVIFALFNVLLVCASPVASGLLNGIDITACLLASLVVLVICTPVILFYIFLFRSLHCAKKSYRENIIVGKASGYVGVILILMAVFSLVVLFGLPLGLNWFAESLLPTEQGPGMILESLPFEDAEFERILFESKDKILDFFTFSGSLFKMLAGALTALSTILYAVTIFIYRKRLKK